MGKIDFSQNFHWAILVIDHKCSFSKKKQQNLMTGFGEIGQNSCFGAKWPFLVNFWAKMAKTIFFWKNAKMSLPYAYYAATLCKKQNEPMNGF